MTKRQRVVNYEDGGPDEAVAAFIADVLELAGLFRRGADGIAREEGQTQARWYALSVFSAEPLTVSQAARRLGTTRQGLQRTADDLVDRGLATVEPNPDHRTSPFIRLTEEGRAVLTRISEAATVTRRRWLPDPDLDELEGAHAVVRRLRDTLREQL
nr:MarR family transcriptional regulator [Patulibacter americanus]